MIHTVPRPRQREFVETWRRLALNRLSFIKRMVESSTNIKLIINQPTRVLRLM